MQLSQHWPPPSPVNPNLSSPVNLRIWASPVYICLKFPPQPSRYESGERWWTDEMIPSNVKRGFLHGIKEQEAIFSSFSPESSIYVASVLFHHRSDDEAVLNAWNLIPFCLSLPLSNRLLLSPIWEERAWGVWLELSSAAADTVPHILPSPAFLPTLEV